MAGWPTLTHAMQGAGGGVGKPNIVWLIAEDFSPYLGCYGAPHARTAAIDRLAAEGVRFTQAYSNAPVCAPARSCLMSGMYPVSVGTHHMRSREVLPVGHRCFPELLRRVGYFTTNSKKTDYNFDTPPDAWDAAGSDLHWREPARRADQPFFCQMNFGVTHEGTLHLTDSEFRERHVRDTPLPEIDEASIDVPPYMPDTPEARADIRRHLQAAALLDAQVAQTLDQLETDGLLGNTIVFFFGDHGSALPRGKRWLYQAGVRVPLIVRTPAQYRRLAPRDAGSTTDRLVSFVDFAPTVLSLAGLPAPGAYQGAAFAGAHAGEPRQMVFLHRDRMDARHDMCRAVCDGRHKLIVNFHPWQPYGHYLAYPFRTPSMRAWRRFHDEGMLDERDDAWFRTKPPLELFDLADDPHEVDNLAEDPSRAATLGHLLAALTRQMRQVRDLGLLPEGDTQVRWPDVSPYDAIRPPGASVPWDDMLAAALPARAAALMGAGRADPGSPDAAVRYWATLGLRDHATAASDAERAVALATLDPSPFVRLAAGRVLVLAQRQAEAVAVAMPLLGHESPAVRLQAVELLADCGDAARVAEAQLEESAAPHEGYLEDYIREAVGYATQHFAAVGPSPGKE